MDARLASPPPAVPGARWIPLTQGEFALVDEDDYDRLNEYTWTLTRSRSGLKYAYCARFKMHRAVLRLTGPSPRVDHVNGDGLDNRKANLRTCDQRQNIQHARLRSDNASGFKGVYWHKAAKRWHASIKVGDKKLSLGFYDTAEEAASAYNRGALDHFGEFAWLNPGVPIGAAYTGLRRTNKSGHEGIRRDGNRWVAFVDKKRLGTFKSIEDAVQARKEHLEHLSVT